MRKASKQPEAGLSWTSPQGRSALFDRRYLDRKLLHHTFRKIVEERASLLDALSQAAASCGEAVQRSSITSSVAQQSSQGNLAW